jgi:hypothetical protein
MTAVQQRLIASIQQKAEVASAAAKPRLLGLLGSPDFTAALVGCCAGLAAMSAAERLAWFDAESAAAEQVHNFGQGEGDETIAYGMNATYFYNLWEVGLLGREVSPAVHGKDNCTSNPKCKDSPQCKDNPQCNLPNCTAHPDVTCGGNGRCSNEPASQRGYVCRCNTTWSGPNCQQQTPENCSHVHSRAACENTTYSGRLSPDSCVWVSAERRCRPTTPGSDGSGSRHQPQATDVSQRSSV